MPIDIPDFDTGTTQEWFSYFRLTKYLPGIPAKLTDTLAEASDPACAHRIMTAYAATCVDIAIMYNANRAIDADFLPQLRELFEMPPTGLLHLNAREIATLTSYDADAICEGLKHIGFSLADDGTITGYTPPRQAANPAPRSPKTP